MSYSQNDEEDVLQRVLVGRIKGRFLDIGAFDGKTFSNTLRLVEQEWSGVCVEPSPNSFDALLRLHGNNPKIELVNCAIGIDIGPDRPLGLSIFYDSGGDAVSTMSPDHVRKWELGSKVKFRKYWLQLLPMDRLFQHFGYDFDFINLDVEACNWSLFQHLPLALLTNLKALCVEHDGKHGQMLELAGRFGFKQESFNGENLILVR